MDRWLGKVAVVTGASAGIGAAIVRDLIRANLLVVGLARRPERIDCTRQQYNKEQQDRLYSIKCDVTDEESVKEAFKWVQQNLGGADILINCAGVLKVGNLVDSDSTAAAKETMDTNVMSTMYCTREAFQQMKMRGVDGHVVILNSMAGHKIPELLQNVPMFNMYFASKFAVTGLIETFRQEFAREGTRVKITSISPGYVETDLFPIQLRRAVPNISGLSVDDISSSVIYALSTPVHVQVREIILDALLDPQEIPTFKTIPSS